MTATSLTLHEDTRVRPVPPVAPHDAVPLRRQRRDTVRSGGAEDRVPALSALDAAAEYVLVVRDGDRLVVFAEGGLAAQDSEGRDLRPSPGGQELHGGLPLLVSPAEDGDISPPSAEDTAVPAAPVEASAADDAGSLLQSLPELGETNHVPGFVRGSATTENAAEELPLAEADADIEESPEAYLGVELHLPDGRRISADHTVLLGRSPSARADEPDTETVALASNLTDISRNHLEIRMDGDSVLARDLGSTNGTVLTRPGQSPRLLPTEEAVRVVPGDSLNLGGSATIEVEGLR